MSNFQWADPNVLQFTVLGHAAPQGSSKIVGFKTGRPRITSDNPKMKPWRQMVGWVALTARAEAGCNEVWAGRHVAVALEVEFYFARPQSVTRKRLLPAVKPDLDKLCRAIFDACAKGILWCDDGQVVQLTARKHYGNPERAEIKVERIS